MVDRSKLKASLIATVIAANGANGAYAEASVRDAEGHKIEMKNSNSRDEVKLKAKDLDQILMSTDLYNNLKAKEPNLAAQMRVVFFKNVSTYGKLSDKDTVVGITAEGLAQAMQETGFHQEEIQQAMPSFYEKQNVQANVHTVGFEGFRNQSKQGFEDFKNQSKQDFNTTKTQMKKDSEAINSSNIVHAQSVQVPTAGLDCILGAVEYNGKECAYTIHRGGTVEFANGTDISGNINYLLPRRDTLNDGSYQCGPLVGDDKTFLEAQVASNLRMIKLEHEVYKKIQSEGIHSSYEKEFVNQHKKELQEWGLEITKDGNLKQNNPRFTSITNSHMHGR